MLRFKSLVLFVIIFCSLNIVNAAKKVKDGIILPSIFNHEMVLQREKKIPIWGWSKPNTQVKVYLNGESKKVIANKEGKWLVYLSAMRAGGPYSMSIKGIKNTVVLNNILIGEVWICSGQSNMEMPLLGYVKKKQKVEGSKNAIATANYPKIRLFHLKRSISPLPKDNCVGLWRVCSPKTVAEFSATAFFFGRKLKEKLKDVPIGLIMTARGGSRVEAWSNRKSMSTFKVLKSEMGKIAKFAKNPKKNKMKFSSYNISSLYNGMIAPLVPMAIRGVIWYQGESNAGNAQFYRKAFPAMVKGWRKDFKQGDFPFYYVQIAPFLYCKKINGGIMRNVQRECLSLIPKSGMASIMDFNSIKCIHPPQKKECGERLASLALNKDYGFKLACNGPLYRQYKIQGNKIRLFFNYVQGGIISKKDKITGFEIAGGDGKYYPAQAVIDGETIIVSNEKVKFPRNARYAWKTASLSNLWNKEKLPMSTFTTLKY